MSNAGVFLVTIPIWDQFIGLLKLGLTTLVGWTGSPGLAIIIYTIIIKLILTPLNVRTIKSQRAMQDLQPKIRAIQKRYGDDRQKVSAETMRLYQEEGINPMSSCLPMLFQLPLFWALYSALTQLAHTPEFQKSFLWVPSLSEHDPWRIMPFIAAGFQLIQTRMSMPTGKYKPTDPQQRTMNQLMQFMPLMVIFFGWSFPAGLVLYWATQSVFGAVQQYFITGWGALREWIPFLPEVVRYTPPEPDAVDDSRLHRGEGGSAAATRGGFWGLINKQVQKIEEQRNSTSEATTAPPPAKSTTRAPQRQAQVNVQSNGKSRSNRGDSDTDAEKTSAPEPSARISVRKTVTAPANGDGGSSREKRRPR